MGSRSSHEDCEVEFPRPVDAGTPAYRNLSSLDPRSPTLEIVRTPLEVPPTHHSRLRRLVSLLDPRSPSLHLNRTPLQRASEAKPFDGLPTPDSLLCLPLDLDDAENAEAENAEAENAEAENAEAENAGDLKSPTDLKLARALFFGDSSVSESQTVQPSVPEAGFDAEGHDEVETGTDPVARGEAEAEAVADDDEAEFERWTETVATPTRPAFAGVKRAELSALPRRRGDKENVVRKRMLLHTPDKARVRTPLSNVSSFHNSPLRR